MKNTELKENRKLPKDGLCRYCGGDIWRLKDGQFKCGHCLRTYSLKGNSENEQNKT